jgi:outer membrane protein assembly factor BamB
LKAARVGAEREGHAMRHRQPAVRTGSALLLTALLTATSLLAPGAQAAGTAVRFIDSGVAHPARTWEAFDSPGPTLVDVDGDGHVDIVDQSTDRDVVVVDGVTGQLKATLEPRYPPGWSAQPINPVSVARLAPGEPPSIVVPNSAGVVTAWTLDGRDADGTLQFRERFSTVLRDCDPQAPQGMDGGVAIADLDRDGRMEILGQTENLGLFMLREDGSLAWRLCLDGGNAEPTAGDLRGDGRTLAVFSSDSGHVRAVDAQGKVVWSFDAQRFVQPASIPVSATLADLDGDGRLEVLFTARDAHLCCDPDGLGEDHMAIVALGSDGALRWEQRPAWADPLSYTHLVVADVDGDGTKDVLGFDWNTIGHKPGAWEVLPVSHAFALGGKDGHELWHRDVENYWSNDDVAVRDLDGDGHAEMLVPGVSQGHDGLWVLDAASGAPRDHWDTWPWKTMRGPELADLDRDGRAEVVVSVAAECCGTHGGAFAVFEPGALGAPAPAASTAQAPAATPEALPAPPANATEEPAGPAPAAHDGGASDAGDASDAGSGFDQPPPPRDHSGLLGLHLLGL